MQHDVEPIQTRRALQARSTKRAIVAAFLGNTAIGFAKLVGAVVSGSTVMLAEAAHSFADSGNQLVLLLGLKLGVRPADQLHPFGYGKERYFWTFFAAGTMLVVGSAFSIFQGVSRLVSPREVSHFAFNYGVLAIAFVLEGYAFTLAFRGLRTPLRMYGFWEAIRRTKDPTLFLVLLEDGAALIGIGLAFLGLLVSQLTGIWILDPIASILIGGLLGAAALLLGVETRSLLLGESASPAAEARIKEAVVSVPEVAEVLDMLTMHLGPDEILVNLDLNFEDSLDTDQIEDTVDRIEDRIRQAEPRAKRIFIEAESIKRYRRSGAPRA